MTGIQILETDVILLVRLNNIGSVQLQEAIVFQSVEICMCLLLRQNNVTTVI